MTNTTQTKNENNEIASGFELVGKQGWNRSQSQKEIKDDKPDPVVLGMAARYAKNCQILKLIETYQDRLASSDDPKEEIKLIIKELEEIKLKEVKRHEQIKDILNDPEAFLPLAAKEILKALNDPELKNNPFLALSSLKSSISRDLGFVGAKVLERIPSQTNESIENKFDLDSRKRFAMRCIDFSDDPVVQKRGVKFFQDLLKSDPKDPHAAWALGRALLDGRGIEENDSKGIDLLKMGLKDNPKDPLLLGILGYLYTQGFTENGKVVLPKDNIKAEEYFKKALEADPKHIYALGVYADYLRINGRGYEAFDLYVRLINSESRSSWGHEGLGYLYRDGFIDGMGIKQQNDQKALEYFKIAADLGNEEAKASINQMGKEGKKLKRK